MPQAIIILEFDQYEGALVTFKYPPEFEVEDKYLQQIYISHNFISSIMVNEYALKQYDQKKVSAISYYNADTLKTIILFLTRFEDGQDYYDIITQVNDIVSQKDISKEQYEAELIRMYKLSLGLIGVRQQIGLKLATEVANLKMEIHDYHKRLDLIMNRSNNTENRILLSLCLKETQLVEELFKSIKGVKKKSTFNNAIKRLVDAKLVKKTKNVIQINF